MRKYFQVSISELFVQGQFSCGFSNPSEYLNEIEDKLYEGILFTRIKSLKLIPSASFRLTNLFNRSYLIRVC